MKKYKSRIITAFVVVALLIFTFVIGEEPENTTDGGTETVSPVVAETVTQHSNSDQKNDIKTEESTEQKANIKGVPSVEETPVENADIQAEPLFQFVCTMSVRCDDILENIDKLPEEKRGLVPTDGIIYNNVNVGFNEGESAFDLLLREMRSNNIHIEFEYTPAFDSSYIEGIGNLYEFDCGDMSGWTYRVNGKSANCGSSQYILSDGDVVEWVYICG